MCPQNDHARGACAGDHTLPKWLTATSASSGPGSLRIAAPLLTRSIILTSAQVSLRWTTGGKVFESSICPEATLESPVSDKLIGQTEIMAMAGPCRGSLGKPLNIANRSTIDGIEALIFASYNFHSCLRRVDALLHSKPMSRKKTRITLLLQPPCGHTLPDSFQSSNQ